MTEGTPARIDRAALERIIQRAAELQTAEREIGESLTPDEVLALGREVGIPGRYLQQALLEERTRLAEPGPAGPARANRRPAAVTAQRVVRGEPDSVEPPAPLAGEERAALRAATPARPDHLGAVGGFQAAFRRSTGASGESARSCSRGGHGVRTVLELEPGYTNVALTATARKASTESVGGSAALASGGVVPRCSSRWAPSPCPP